MEQLTLPSLQIEGFKAFKSLTISKLNRVNLIVGKNNVGKSTLLEAIRIYSGGNIITTLIDILRSRDEIFPLPSIRRLSVDEFLSSIRFLFYGRKRIENEVVSFGIGPVNGVLMKLSLVWLRRVVQTNPERVIQLEEVDPKSIDLEQMVDENISPRIAVSEDNVTRYFSLDSFSENVRLYEREFYEASFNCIYTGPDGMQVSQIGRLWDNVALTESEEDVLEALKIIAPGITGLTFVENWNTASSRKSAERIPIIKIKGLSEPLPLKSLGQGMQRVLGIALAIVNAKNGVLIIDEIENGIHYSVLPHLWSLIFKSAQQLNVQVFTTTHSWDCIQAFQQSSLNEQSLLIRLDNRENMINATLFDKKELAIATRENIEVR